MPLNLKKALYSMNTKLNLNSSALLQATEILIQEAEQMAEGEEDLQDLDAFEDKQAQDEKSNKYIFVLTPFDKYMIDKFPYYFMHICE